MAMAFAHRCTCRHRATAPGTFTREYRAGMDMLGQFIDECCELVENGREHEGRLCKAYTDPAGSDAIGKIEFGRGLKDRGILDIRGNGGTREWQGVQLLPTEPLNEVGILAQLVTCHYR